MHPSKLKSHDSSVNSSKHLSEFYTKDLNAQLLAHCTLRFPNDAWSLQSDLETWCHFYVGDLACGEGTLLKSLYLEMKNILIELGSQAGLPPQLTAFHKLFVEDLCFGFDVVREAVTTALENITSLEPSLPKGCGNFFAMPLGKTPAIRLGSLDFLKTITMKSGPQKITGSRVVNHQKTQREEQITLPSFQILLLNPPFARSCGDNLLFGTLPKKDREEMTSELKRVRKEIGTTGIGQAGQAADFIYLAQQLVAPGGRFSFIVPKSLCYGPSWVKLRQFLVQNVEVECLLFNYEYPHFGFSERTQLAECMVIARNTLPHLGQSHEPLTRTLVVNILKSPADAIEMNALQHELVEVFKNSRELTDNPRYTTLFLPQNTLYEYCSNWAQVLGFYSPVLCRTHFQLIRDKTLAIPGAKQTLPIPLASLQSLGTIGYDRKQVTENTVDGPGSEQLIAVWGRDNRDFTTIQVKPTGSRYMKPEKRSHLYPDFQQSASHLLLPETLWLETTRVFSVYCTEPAISNVFWTFSAYPALKSRDGKPIADWELEQILALWGNSTVGILLFLGLRQETRGPWVHWKKNLLGSMLTLDPRQLTRAQVDSLLGLCMQFLPRQPLLDATFMPAIVAGEKLSLDLPLFQTLLEDSPDPVPLDVLRRSLGKLYHSFTNPVINPWGLA